MKKWKIREKLSEKLEEQLLFSRGITEKAQIKIFLEPNYENVHDPFLLLDMEKAVSRILAAIGNNERIILFSDYDADGVCGAAVFHDFFKKIGFENFKVIIPDRNKEGYGLSLDVVKEIREEKAGLLITIDCGISDFDAIKEVKKIGVETIIVDHHIEHEKLPEAYAIIDPRMKKEKYPYKTLVGAGVAFKVVQALIRRGDFNIVPGWEKWLLDLVAVATIADMMPLDGENRLLTYFGLLVLNKTNRIGFLSFFDKFNLTPGRVNEDDVAFTIAPKINIASRMDHANVSYALLTTESKNEADWTVGHLDSLNVDRRKSVDGILKEVDDKFAGDKKSKIIVAGNSSWGAGVLGLTAARIMDKYNYPVFLWGGGMDGTVKGSARSKVVNLVELMAGLPEGILLDWGGHAFSAGFSMNEDSVDEFEKEIKHAFGKIEEKEMENILWIDKELIIDEIDWRFLRQLEKLAPFGQGNPKPVFLLRDLEVYECKMFGNDGLHMKLSFKKKGGGVISAIGFFMKNEEPEKIDKGTVLNLAASVERNTFRNKDELRLRIVDLKKADSPVYD